MSEPTTDFERRLQAELSAYLDQAALERPAGQVVADVVGRPVSRGGWRRLAPALVAALVLLAGAVAIVGPRLLDFGQGSSPTTATVDGRVYVFGAAFGMIIDQVDLLPAGQISAASYPEFVGATAYQLPGVDPAEALVTPAQGLLGPVPIDWAILFGQQQGDGRPSDVFCSYYRLEARGEFSGCPADIGIVQLFPDQPLPRPYDWWGVREALAGRGFELNTPTAAELARLGRDPAQVVRSFEEQAQAERARLVSVHVAAVGLDIERLGLERTRELMYVGESTGHATGNCFELVPATESEVPMMGACFFTNRGDPADATPAPPTPTPSPTPVGFDFEGRLAPTLGTGCVRVAGHGRHVALVGLPRGYWFIDDETDFVHVAGPLGLVSSTGNWVGLRGEFVGDSADCPGLRAFRATELLIVEEPEPFDGGPVAIQPLSSHTYALGASEVTVVRELVPGLGWPTFGSPRVADEGLLALVHRDPDTGAGTLWLADLESGELRRIGGVFTSVDAQDGRLLVGERDMLRVYDVRRMDGGATLPGQGLRGAFLADGMVVAWAADQVGVWNPADGTVSWSQLPGLPDRFTVTAVGTNIAVITETTGMLLDPRSGQQIGDSWRADAFVAYEVVASPDGTRFVVAVAGEEPVGALELRDAATGEVLAVNAGERSHVVGLAWPTDDVIVVMRAATGAEAAPRPELLRASDFGASPLPIEPFVPHPFALSAGVDQLVALDDYGDLVVVRFSEASR